jgi:hypothetical protein
MSHADVASSECLNCQSPLHGRYCASCGQQAGHVNPSLGEVLHDLVHELLHVDGKLFRSVGLLLGKPGFLTQEYFAGRRARYLPPLRLYLIFSVVYFAVSAAFPNASTDGFNVELTPNAGETQADIDARLETLGFSDNQALRDETNRRIRAWLPRAMFVLVPFFAVLVAVLLRGSGYNYPQHLYFALHVHAAVMAIGALGHLAGLIPNNAARVAIQLPLYSYNMVYVGLAIRRVYSRTVFGSLWRIAVIGPVYMVSILLVAIVIAVATMPELFGRT